METIRYSVVIPIKDEEENIIPLVEELELVMKELNEPWELICIDDGSTDGSLHILQELCKEKSFMQVLSFTRNFGQSSAFSAGFEAARGTFVITLDGDRQNDPADIPKLTAAIENYDLVVGWRINRRDPWKKRIISKAANWIRSRLCRDDMHDTGCSLKIYRAEALRKIKMYRGMHRFLPALFAMEGYRIHEVPVNHRERGKGKTKYNFFNRSLGPICDMFVVRWMRNRTLKHEVRDKQKLYMFAGEHSGDVLGGKLIRALESENPDLSLLGVGGPDMRAAGLQCTTHMERFQVMGYTDVIKALPRLYKDFRRVKKEILASNPEGVVFIDYPDFNMRMAKALRKSGYKGKLIHYVCPSVWAWRKGRVKDLASSLDRLLTILPFEEKCFAKTNLPISFVGHPLISAIAENREEPERILGIFPGSRRGEIERNLPIQLKVAKRFEKEFKSVISVARPELEEIIRHHTGPEVELEHDRYALMRKSYLALATSGTVVLELGLHSVPTVATYQLPPLNYFLGRYIFRVILPFYTLPNIISDREIFPEFFHKNLDEQAITDALRKFADDPNPCKEACAHMRTLLQQHDASSEAAKVITHELSLS